MRWRRTYDAVFLFIRFARMLCCAPTMVAFVSLPSCLLFIVDKAVVATRAGQVVVTLIGVPLMAIGINGLRPRPALHALPKGESILMMALKQATHQLTFPFTTPSTEN